VRVRLSSSFAPDRLGASTTVGFTLTISGPDGAEPPALTDLKVELPAGMTLIESQLGFATCSEQVLIANGASACPPDSRMGFGETSVRFGFGPAINEDRATITAFLGEAPGPGLPLLIAAEVFEPIFGTLVFPSRLENDSGRFGEQLSLPLPLIPTLPEAPPASITRVQVTFGPNGLVYYRREHGRTIAFKPHGLSVPGRCPRGGFPLDASLTFSNGAHLIAPSRIGCPTRT
jgi:hypothetical protein